MKRLWIVFMMFLLAACGGGGGGDTTVAGQPAAGVPGDGTVTVKFTTGTAKMLALPASPDPTWVRVVANGSTKTILDVAIGSANEVTLSLAAGTYDIKALYYVKEGSLNRMLRYGKASVVITAGINTSLTVPINDILATVTAPVNPVFAGSQYLTNAPTATTPQLGGTSGNPLVASPLRADWALFAQTTEFTSPKHLALPTDSIVSHTNEVVPAAISAGRLYFQGEFFIDDSMISDTEVKTSWVFTSPNPQYDLPVPYTPVSCPLSVTFSNNLATDTYSPRMSSFSVYSSVHSTTVTGITLSATDNVGVTGYQIKASALGGNVPVADTILPATVDTTALDPTWLTPTSSYNLDLPSGLQDGDQFYLYAWARDKHGNISTVMSSSTDVKPLHVIYRSSPVVTLVEAPTTPKTSDTDLTYNSIKIYASGLPSPTDCAITDTPVAPTENSTMPDDGKWQAWAVTPAGPFMTRSYTFATAPKKDLIYQHGAVSRTLYAWVKNAQGVSEPYRFAVQFNDTPVVTFTVTNKNPVNGAVIMDPTDSNKVTNIRLSATSGISAPGLEGLVTSTSVKPAATATWSAMPITDYTFSAPTSGSKTLYGWVRDKNGTTTLKTLNILVP